MNSTEALMERIVVAMERIATSLEGLLESTNPLNVYNTPPSDEYPRAQYTNEEEDIVRFKLAQMGKEYKPRV